MSHQARGRRIVSPSKWATCFLDRRRTLKSKFSLTSPSVRPCMRASIAITLKRRRSGSSSWAGEAGDPELVTLGCWAAFEGRGERQGTDDARWMRRSRRGADCSVVGRTSALLEASDGDGDERRRRTRRTRQGRAGSIRSASVSVGVEMVHQTRAGPAVEAMSTKGIVAGWSSLTGRGREAEATPFLYVSGRPPRRGAVAGRAEIDGRCAALIKKVCLVSTRRNAPCWRAGPNVRHG
jgi:hypothetical protein